MTLFSKSLTASVDCNLQKGMPIWLLRIGKYISGLIRWAPKLAWSAAHRTGFGGKLMRSFTLIVLTTKSVRLKLGWCFGGHLDRVRWDLVPFLILKMDRRLILLFIRIKSCWGHSRTSGKNYLGMWLSQLSWETMHLCIKRCVFLSDESWEWGAISTLQTHLISTL